VLLPQGIQPAPKRASRRIAGGETVPLTQIGMPFGWAGFGIM